MEGKNEKVNRKKYNNNNFKYTAVTGGAFLILLFFTSLFSHFLLIMGLKEGSELLFKLLRYFFSSILNKSVSSLFIEKKC